MAQLCHHTDKFQELNTKVVIISFGTNVAANTWLQETCTPFELLRDPDRTVYRAYGLERSFLRSWGPKTIWQYIRLLTSGRKWKGVQGDSAQLGGDFIIDKSGNIKLAYRSIDPTDRPSFETILSILQTINH